MKRSLRLGLIVAAMVGLCTFPWAAQAQDATPAQPAAPAAAQPPAKPTPPAPPVNVEAPDRPAAPRAPDVEAPARDSQSAENPSSREDWWSSRDRARWSRRWARSHHNENDRVVIGGNATLEKGQQADSVVSVFGSSTSEGDAQQDVVSVFGDTRVTGSAKDVVAVLGSVYLNGKAAGDVVATLGNVELGPQAEVNGNVVVVGGTLKRDPAAVIHGDVQNVLSLPFGSFEWLRPWMKHCLLLMRPLAIAPGLGWAWGLSLGFLALYVLIGVLFQDAVDRCVHTFETQPGKSILAALLTTVLTPVMFALLFITVIGIAFVPVAALGLFLMGLFGKAVMLAWIGRSCLRLSGDGASLRTAFAVLIGGVVVLVLYLVPIVGFIVYKALGILGLGVAVYALMLNVKQRRGDSGPTPAMAGGPTGGGTTYSSAAYSSSTNGTDAVAGTTYGYATPRFTEPGVSGSPAGGEGISAMGGISDAGPGSGSAPGSGPASGQGSAQESGSAAWTASGQGPASASGPSGAPPGAGGYSGGPSRSGSAIDPATAITYPRAGFAVRMAALFIDVILVAVLLGIIDSTKEAEMIALAMYGAIMWKLKSTTIGGIVFGLQVVRLDGRPIDWATATVRALSCFLSLVVAGLGFIWIAFDEGHQAWHDKIAGTAVVRVPKGVSLL